VLVARACLNASLLPSLCKLAYILLYRCKLVSTGDSRKKASFFRPVLLQVFKEPERWSETQDFCYHERKPLPQFQANGDMSFLTEGSRKKFLISSTSSRPFSHG
jgi:hypothetical protein